MNSSNLPTAGERGNGDPSPPPVGTTLEVCSGVSGAFFHASLHDLLFGSRHIQSVPLESIVGAYEWWLEPNVVSRVRAFYRNKYGFDMVANFDNAWSDFWARTVEAGERLTNINQRSWSEIQLKILHGSGINVDEAAIRTWRNKLLEQAGQCFSQFTCPYSKISWPGEEEYRRFRFAD